MKLNSLIVLSLLASTAVHGETKINIYGGPDNSQYLGCYSCPRYSQESVHNPNSPYGSAYSVTSIFNKYGKYGSSYSSFSPCSDFAANPPILRDDKEISYGSLSVNKYRADRSSLPGVQRWLNKEVCQKEEQKY